MTIICLMLFITICVLSSALSLKNSMTSNLKELAPIDIELYKKRNVNKEDASILGYNEYQIEDTYHTIEESLEKVDFDIDDYLKDIVHVNIYATNELAFLNTLGSELETVKKEFPYIDLYSAEAIVKISEYNQVAKLYGNPTYELEEDEYMIIADFDSMIAIRNKTLEKGTTITLGGKTLSPKYSECKEGFIEISSNHINTGIILVPDDVINEEWLEEEHLLANYIGDTDEEKEETENIIINLENHPNANMINLSASTKITIYEASIGLGAMVTFIGLYLGIVFLISSAAILALKELTESTDNKERFDMLRKIGTDEKMIHKALFTQILIFFMFPLVLAIIHSIFGIMFCDYILATFGNEELLKSIVMTASLIVVIYGGYFFITYYCSKNIIKSR